MQYSLDYSKCRSHITLLRIGMTLCNNIECWIPINSICWSNSHETNTIVLYVKGKHLSCRLSVARWCGMTEVSSQDPTTLIKPILSSSLFLLVILRTFECQDAIKAGNFEQFKGCFTRLKLPLEIAEKTVEKYAGM